ncbi:MAG: hypothetical protein Q7R40_07940 [Phaeospirillum sp.]|nr:hypothetical protein [Phaeospirillum sp.]
MNEAVQQHPEPPASIPHWRREDPTCRKDPFRRLMVWPLESLLTRQPPEVSRDFLDHYFQFLDILFAEEMGGYERRCRMVLQALRVIHGQSLTWDVFYADPRTNRILTHALRRLITFLDSPTGRWAWPHTVSRPSKSGHTPTSEEAEQVILTLRDAWRNAEFNSDPTEEARGG